MEELQINMVLGERLDLASTTPEAVKYNERGQRVVKTVTGRELAADLLVSLLSLTLLPSFSSARHQ